MPHGKTRQWSSCIYIGAIGGKYWFIQHSYVKYMYRIGGRTITKVWCRISDALCNKKLWESLPREVRHVIVQVYGEPTFSHVNKVDLEDIATSIEYARDVFGTVIDVLSIVTPCPRCGTKLRTKIAEAIKTLDSKWILPSYDYLEIVEDAYKELDATYRKLMELTRK